MTLSPLVSRVLVALIGLPAVLGIVYLGGWWLFALAAVAAVLALHEYALMIRSLRPVILAAYTGALLSLLGAHLGGLEWTVPGFLSTILLAFLLHQVAETRQSATIAIASTVLGAAGSASVSHTWSSCARFRTTVVSRRSPCCSRSGPGTSGPSSQAG